MKPQSLWLGVMVGCAGMVMTGCEALHRAGLRSKADPEIDHPVIPAEGESTEEQSTSAPKGFFKPTRLPGGLSSEAAEIERDLGVIP